MGSERDPSKIYLTSKEVGRCLSLVNDKVRKCNHQLDQAEESSTMTVDQYNSAVDALDEWLAIRQKFHDFYMTNIRPFKEKWHD